MAAFKPNIIFDRKVHLSWVKALSGKLVNNSFTEITTEDDMMILHKLEIGHLDPLVA